mmetsp:Transcript_46658/g.107817  ORF Transcript_46658/g.107817 Transcript_46658/m.107817 type:complete len:336 (-) Transcript_46658:701-1708(-)
MLRNHMSVHVWLIFREAGRWRLVLNDPFALGQVLCQESLVELLHASEDASQLVFLRKDCDPVMPSARSLPKTTPRHHDHTRGLQHPHAVGHVRRLPLCLCFFKETPGQHDLWEGVHCPFDREALHPLHGVELAVDQVSFPLKVLEDAVALLGKKLVGLLTRRWRVQNGSHHGLPQRVRAECHGEELVDLVIHGRINVCEVEYATAQAALSIVALGHGVEGEELHWCSHREDNLSERHKRLVRPPNVVLVHFVSEYHDAVFCTELHNGLYLCPTHHIPCGVAWVDHGDCADMTSTCQEVANLGFDDTHIDAPARAGGVVFHHRVSKRRATQARDGG